MKRDIRIENEYFNFHFRVAAVIMQNNKYLIQQIDGYDYFVLPGGHVEFGEDSIEAIKREVKEEVGCAVDNANFFCLHENFYPQKNKTEHWVEMYFKITIKEELSNENWYKKENDKGKEKLLHYQWVTSEELNSFDLRPSSIKDILVNNKIDELTYLIDKE